ARNLFRNKIFGFWLAHFIHFLKAGHGRDILSKKPAEDDASPNCRSCHANKTKVHSIPAKAVFIAISLHVGPYCDENATIPRAPWG
ncbi:MAG: hypothetical protein ACR2RA_14430, partial [Geminicoccaceae bacterium]